MRALIEKDWLPIETDNAQAQTAPTTPRKTTPLLMSDILISVGGEPEFVRRWRAERDAD